MSNFVLSCESTVDMPYSYINGRNIDVIFYSYLVNETEYPDDMERDPAALPMFYNFIKEGNIPTTSQINTYTYKEHFRTLLENGNDVLHICFGTGMTQSYRNAMDAVSVLAPQYPDRKLIVIDSLCSSSGYGMLVDYAADLRDEGKTIDEVSKWVSEHLMRIHHQFFTTDLQYFKRTGRMSGPVSTIATILNICPIMRLDKTGHIIAYDKVRGKKAAIQRTIRMMEEHAENGTEYSGKVFVCHSDCPEQAAELVEAIKPVFPNVREIRTFNIGTIIASHCGPGTTAVFFLGDERAE